MTDKRRDGSMNRREFGRLVTAGISYPLIAGATGVSTQASPPADGLIYRNQQPTMTYRRLGRTNFMSSRLVFGCGAALMGGKGVRLLDRAFEAGINNYDVGSDVYYKGSEQAMAPFMKAHRENIWVASKAPLWSIRFSDPITSEQARAAAAHWTRLLDASLNDLQTDYVDAYYVMGIDNPAVVRSEEMYQAFLDARAAGKVGYFGLSTHKNAAEILEAAIKTGWYDLAMIGITPAGWYDWTTKELEEGTPPLTAIQPFLKRARDAGIGLIGMKAVRYLAPMSSMGKGDPTAFDDVYSDEFKASSLTPFQRAYVYTLEHGIDVMNADMQNFTHLEENIVAAATAHADFE